MKAINFLGNVGFEIEGIVKKKNRDKLRNVAHELDYDFSDDGSIRNYNYTTENSVELKSKIYNVNELETLFKDVRKILKLIRVNDSCGLHIHLSFEKMSNYYKLICWKFVEQFQEKYNLTFIDENEQKRKELHYSKFYPTEVVFNLQTKEQVSTPKRNGKPHSRYHSINFNAFNHYKTVEFRIFAATNKITKFKKYVKFLIENVDKYLKNEKFDEINAQKKVKIPKNEKKVIIQEVIKKEDIQNINSRELENV